jgi:hypothetical protein
MVVVGLVALRPARRRAQRQATESRACIRSRSPLRPHRRGRHSSQRDEFHQPGLVNIRVVLKSRPDLNPTLNLNPRTETQGIPPVIRLSGHTPSQLPKSLVMGRRRARVARRALCGSTVLGTRSRYVFMTPVLQSLLAQDGCGSPREINGAGASLESTACLSHGARPFTRGNPRLLRRVDTTFAFIESHPV